MNPHATEQSRPYEYLSPSSYEAMRACRLRAAFASLGRGHRVERAGAAVYIGNICHRVLESVVKSKALTSDGWDSAIESSWDSEVRRELASLAAAAVVPADEDPRRWPDFEL